MYNPKDIIEVIAGNVKKTRSPFGIPRPLVNNWWKKMGLRREGEALLFTGMMYQFMPYIEMTTRHMAKLEDTRLGSLVRFGKYQPKRLSGIGLAMITPGEEKKKANENLQNIAKVLTKSKVDFYYEPKLDFYSGILLYDLGDQEGFVEHARFVAERLRKAGVKKIITVDPHTTYALKVLYPQYTGVQFEVKAYFELVNFKSNNGTTQVTLHDPCFYGRYLELSDGPRKALERLGVQCVEVRSSGISRTAAADPRSRSLPSLQGK